MSLYARASDMRVGSCDRSIENQNGRVGEERIGGVIQR